jgi:primosomal protein N''
MANKEYIMVSFEQRVKNIKTVEDAEEQIRKAKDYVRRLKLKSKAQDTLTEKIALQEEIKMAERVLRQMRRAIWDIEDALAVGKPATSILESTASL